MRLSGKHILLISPEPWEGLHMSKHHMAEALAAAGNEVCFLGPPDRGSGVRLTGRAPLRVVHRHWLPGINRVPRALHDRYYGRLIARIERLAARPFDIIWCFDTSRMQRFPGGSRFNLLHLVDLDILLTGHDLMRTAHLVVATTDPIVRKVNTIAPDVPAHKVGHALDGRWLAQGTEEAKAPRVPRLVVYASQFNNSYIDWEALCVIAARHPELHFRHVGPFKPDYPDPGFHRLRALPNVEFTGLVEKERLVPMIREADVLLFCFKTDQVGEQCANPHKVLEYLSTGNVTVGTWTMEYEQRPDLLEMARGPADLPDRFDQVLARYPELDAPARRAARIAFARARTVTHLLQHIERLMEQVMTNKAAWTRDGEG